MRKSTSLITERLKTTEEALKIAEKTIAEYERREKESIDDPASKIAALNSIHTKKVRSLMKSIDQLRGEIKVQKSQDKEHRRSGLIQSLRKKERQNELVLDVLKQALKEKAAEFNQDLELVNEFVIAKTTGGPKRFRPKTREELENQVSSLTRQVVRLKKKTKTPRNENNVEEKKIKEEKEQQVDDNDRPNGRILELLNEVDRLKDLLESKTAHMSYQETELEKLSHELDQLQDIQDSFTRVQVKQKRTKEKMREIEEENFTLLQEKERECEQNLQLKTELQFLRDSQLMDRKTIPSDPEHLDHLEQLKDLQLHQIDLQEQIEEYQRQVAAEKCKNAQLRQKCDEFRQETPSTSNIHETKPVSSVQSEQNESFEQIRSVEKQLTASKVLIRQLQKDLNLSEKKYKVLIQSQEKKNTNPNESEMIESMFETELGRARDQVVQLQGKIQQIQIDQEKETEVYLKRLDALKTADPGQKDTLLHEEERRVWKVQRDNLQHEIEDLQVQLEERSRLVDKYLLAYENALIHAHVLREKLGQSHPKLPKLFQTIAAENNDGTSDDESDPDDNDDEAEAKSNESEGDAEDKQEDHDDNLDSTDDEVDAKESTDED